MNKKIYYFSTKVKNNNHAGSKAVNDIDLILSLRSDTEKIDVNYSSNRFLISSIFKIFARLIFKRKRIIVVQETGSNRVLSLISILRKLLVLNKHYFVGLIHDLINLREEKPGREEQKMMKLYDYLISHNDSMTEYLVMRGYSRSRIVNISVFDYLLDKEPITKENSICSVAEVCFAGNLSLNKSGFLYKLGSVIPNTIHFNLYGVNYSDTGNSAIITYHGSFQPEKLPNIIEGNFGLVWDGDEIDACGGKFGNYMRYNNPHKLSFYIASKLPIIIWSKAALSDFVIDMGIGIAINSLKDLNDSINQISESKYMQMVYNVNELSAKLYSGYYTNMALNQIIEKI